MNRQLCVWGIGTVVVLRDEEMTLNIAKADMPDSDELMYEAIQLYIVGSDTNLHLAYRTTLC